MPMELERELKRKGRFPTSSIFLVFVAAAVLLAITYVQHSHVPEWVEISVRTCVSICGLIAVPILLFLAFRNWIRTSRAKSPQWRNGLALSSMVLVSLVWISRFVTSTAYAGPQTGNHVFHVDPLSLLATLLYSNLLAGLLAIFLTGQPRLLVLASVLFLWSGFQSGIYL
jgi:hypothetical protein